MRIRPEFVGPLLALAGLFFTAELQAGSLIGDVTTDSAMYSPNVPVNISVSLTNRTGASVAGTIECSVFHLGRLAVRPWTQPMLVLPAGGTRIQNFRLQPPLLDLRGYYVSIVARDTNGAVLDSSATAVDVSTTWKFPRYGYVAQYSAGLDAARIMSQLNAYHLNLIQFYDWQWKHHLPYSPNPTWPDIANRTIYRSTLTNLIKAAHSFNMVAMNYNLYGGAFDGYTTDGSGAQLAMGIFGAAMPSGGYTLANQLYVGMPGGWATAHLYEMNNRDPAWQNYIFGRELTVFQNFAFDGWHIDSLGTHNAYDANGNWFSLDDANPGFINNTRNALLRPLVFNTVDAGGEAQVAQFAGVEFVYSELWDGNANYSDFNRRVDSVRSYSSKPLVLAAYLNRGLNSGYLNEPAVRLADAAIFASGASHIELGDGDKMLHVEYFPNDNSVLMSPSLKAAMRSYYDFLVVYENLLRDETISSRNAVTVTGAATSTNGSAGAVWVLSKRNLRAQIVHLVNLVNNPSTVWRDNNGTYPAPPLLTNLTVKMYYTGSIGHGGVWYATPDANLGTAIPLQFFTGSDSGGTFVTFTIPSLQYWDMAWLELAGTRDAARRLIASDADTLAGVSLENTSDTGGGYNICCVKNVTGDSYVAFGNVDFGAGATNLSARVASALTDGVIEFHLDEPLAGLVAVVPVGNTGGWQSWQTRTVPLSGAAGVHSVFAVFKNAPSNLNWFQCGLVSSNRTPIPEAPPDATLIAGQTLTFTNSAWDPDAPSQSLSWSLVNAPPGAFLSADGVFNWRPHIAQSPAIYSIELQVMDDGQPPLRQSRSFNVAVNSPARPLLEIVPAEPGQFALRVSGDYGPDYTIEASTDLVDWAPAYETASPLVPFVYSAPKDSSARFYRVVIGP